MTLNTTQFNKFGHSSPTCVAQPSLGWCYLSFHEASFIQVSKLVQISYFLTRVNGCISLIWVLTFTFNTGLSSCNCSYSSKLKYIGQFLSRILPTICFYIKKRYTFCFNEPIVWSSMSFDVLHWFIYFYNLWSIIYIISPVAIFCGRFFQYFFLRWIIHMGVEAFRQQWQCGHWHDAVF